METYVVDNKESIADFTDLIDQDKPEYTVTDSTILITSGEYTNCKFIIKDSDVLSKFKKPSPYDNNLIFGKDRTEKVVSLEIVDNMVRRYFLDGTHDEIPNVYWILSPSYAKGFTKLEGKLHYKYIRTFTDRKEYSSCYQRLKKTGIYTVWNQYESAMLYNGITLFKGLKPEDLSVLSFDLETSGFTHDSDSEVFLITNTFRDIHGVITKKCFRLDEYDNSVEMIESWCNWVRMIDPIILTGTNIFGYDFPYLKYVANRGNYKLCLGKESKDIVFDSRDSQYRVDGTQEWTYKRCHIFGRHIIDELFLAVKYDFGRKYPSWGLKPRAEFEYEELKKKTKKSLTNKEKSFIKSQEGRTFYDASTIRKNWYIPEEREKIVAYAIDDSDDSLYMYDLTVPSYFYYNQSIPKPFELIIQTATGSQINSLLVRSYLQEGHSIPKACPRREYQGAVSFGNPGIWKHVNKLDVTSLYPSIMITEQVYDRAKDPNANFYRMVVYFTKQRLVNKRLAKETGDVSFKDLEQSQKIFINSAYGLLGTGNLNFNSFDWADFVTKTGRDILQTGIKWVCGRELKQIPKLKQDGTPETDAEGRIKKHWVFTEQGEDVGRGFQLVNVDTDSFSYSTGKKLTDAQFEDHIEEVNKLFKKGISWEDDGRFKVVLVNKAKNYALKTYKVNSPTKIKGSGLKATTKELKLKAFTHEIIEYLLTNKKDQLFHLYSQYCDEVIKDDINIDEWSAKKSITRSVLDGATTTQLKILRAIEGTEAREGDKIWVYFDNDEELKLIQNYSNDHNKLKLLEKIYKSLCVFETIVDTSCYPNYSLVKNQKLLDFEITE